jgi:hypothetical protein
MYSTVPNLPALSHFKNGNTDVKILADGTKIRTWPDGESAVPVLPESIDLKITNKCDVGCPFCHESSAPNGKHANPEFVRQLLRQLQPGSEVAIGGGNPLANGGLQDLLRSAADHRLIANMTVNVESALGASSSIAKMRSTGLLHGLGISGTAGGVTTTYNQLAPGLIDVDTVFHFIAGLGNPQDVLRTSREAKTLVLGYKRIGRGIQHARSTPPDLDKWRFFLPSLLAGAKFPISFDNLAIEQLGLKELVPPDEWERRFMGGEGEFTMFVDAVEQTFAVSSTHERWPIAGKSVEEMFRQVRKAAGYE